MDPFTTVIVTAVIQGAVAGLKPTAEQAIKDAYAAFKRTILHRYPSNQNLIKALEDLDQEPEDANRQVTLKNELVRAGATKDPILIEAANAIHVAGVARASKKRIFVERLKTKLEQVEALEHQISLMIGASEKVLLKKQAEDLWKEIEELENKLIEME